MIPLTKHPIHKPMLGANEMSQVKRPPLHKPDNPTAITATHIKDAGSYTCNSSTPMVRQEAKIEESPKAHQTTSLEYTAQQKQ